VEENVVDCEDERGPSEKAGDDLAGDSLEEQLIEQANGWVGCCRGLGCGELGSGVVGGKA